MHIYNKMSSHLTVFLKFGRKAPLKRLRTLAPMILSSQLMAFLKFGSKAPLKKLRNMSLSLRRGP
jgi:hypothetical protein